MKDCKIILRFTYRNHLDELSDCKDEFVSIHDFRNYLRWMPDRAMAIGYTPTDPEKMKDARSSNLKLSILYHKTETLFDNTQEFVKFLQSNPPVAKVLQYGSKKH